MPPTRNCIQGLLSSLAEAASVLLRDIPEWTCPCVTAQWMPNRLGHFIQTWGTWLPESMLCGRTHFCFCPAWLPKTEQLRQQGTEVRRTQSGRSEKPVEEAWITVGSQGVGVCGTDWWESLTGWQGPENCHSRLCWASCFMCARRVQANWAQEISTVTKNTQQSVSPPDWKIKPLGSKSPQSKVISTVLASFLLHSACLYQSFNRHWLTASKCQAGCARCWGWKEICSVLPPKDLPI